MTYKHRNLKFQFGLSSGQFNDEGANILTLENVKAEVQVAAFGGLSANTLDAKIYGMSLKNMGLIGYKGVQYGVVTQNSIKVWAEDVALFSGTIGWAYVDANQMPDAPLIIQASTTGYAQSEPVVDFSQQGIVKIADIITAMANYIKLTVVIHADVNGMEKDPHYTGNTIDQIRTCARNNGLLIDIRLGAIFVWPEGKPVDNNVPYVSKETGLLGYPRFDGWGLEFTTMFSPLLIQGRDVQVQTDLPNASGVYNINSAVHHLSSWIEGGPWMTMCSGTFYNAGR